MMPLDYRPARFLRSPHIQSLLASSGLRRWALLRRPQALERDAVDHVLDCGAGVRLSGRYTAPAGVASRGLVVLLHGWEGSCNSTYVLHSGAKLLAAGFEVFRLNLRDHGDSHGLNLELFHSCRIAEVVGAVAAIARRFPTRPLLMAGFSLGGNFTLRVAQRAPAAGIPLAGFMAVCPVISPEAGLAAIERAPFVYERYFIAKWRNSLARKQALFPEHYDFRPWTRGANLRELTRRLVLEHSEFPSLDAYLKGYSVAGDRLADLQVPGTILTSLDDPVIPVADFRDLVLPPEVDLQITRHGGHCGFIHDLRLDGFAESFLVRRFLQWAEAAPTPGVHYA